MKKWMTAVIVVYAAITASSAHATLMGVTGPDSSLGTAPAIIGAPLHALDDITTNTGMEGFNEAQGVLTSVDHTIDGGGFIAAGTLVDSHMIFLNTASGTFATHGSVVWTFSGAILGTMSDSGGTLEAASTFELGNSATNYTVTFPSSGPAAPFGARGLEGNNSTGVGLFDGYSISESTLTVSMRVTEPGDWIRVVTQPVPEPSAWLLMGSGLVGLAFYGWRKHKQKAVAARTT